MAYTRNITVTSNITGERGLIENNINPLLTIRSAAEILIAPVNITVPPGATAQFR